MKRFVTAVLLSIVVIISTSIPVYATTEAETVAGEGGVTGGTYATSGGGALDWTGMNLNDDLVTYLDNAGTGTIYHTYDMTDFTGAAVDITDVSITGRVYTTVGYTNAYLICRIAGTNYRSSVIGGITGWTTLTTSTFGGVTGKNPATGTNWTAATLNAAEWGFELYNIGGSIVRATYLSLTTTYNPMVSPSVTTSSASSITPTSATMNGEVTNDGGGTIDYYGFVWDTVDEGDPGNADPSVPPGAWASGWKSGVGDYGENTFNHSTGATLIKGTVYYYRAAAHNSIGWTYGSAISFTTIDDPTISTLAASLVASTTARINSNVTFDGNVLTGEPCTVRFVYIAGTGYADYAAIVAGAETTVDVAGTWTTGQSPYADISALAVSTTYSYAVRIVNSTATYAYGSVMTFTTESGVYTPTNFTAVPTASTVSLLWVKGGGAQYTLVKYSAATYPPTTADGMSAYLGTGNSETLTGLTPGTTYYFSAWGLTAGTYSATAITAMATTLAYDTATSTGTIEAPPSNSWWNQTPSTTNVGSIPLVSGLIQANATAYAIPETSLWYFLWNLFSVGMGVFVYGRGGNKLPLGLGATALMFALGAVLGLVMLWIMVIFTLIGTGFALWGDRR